MIRNGISLLALAALLGAPAAVTPVAAQSKPKPVKAAAPTAAEADAFVARVEEETYKFNLLANRVAWVQVSCAAAGVPVMTGGLAGYLLTHAEAFIPAVFAGGALAIAGMALFLAVVLADIRAVAGAAPALRPRAA